MIVLPSWICIECAMRILLRFNSQLNMECQPIFMWKFVFVTFLHKSIGRRGAKHQPNQWMKMTNTHLSPSWPKKNVPITSPIRFSANVFVWYISLEHTQSSWEKRKIEKRKHTQNGNWDTRWNGKKKNSYWDTHCLPCDTMVLSYHFLSNSRTSQSVQSKMVKENKQILRTN